MRLILMLALWAAPLTAETWTFRWDGANGYAMTGAMSYDPQAAGPIIFAQDVQCFVIEGSLNGAPIGRWALTMLNEETSWRLHFDAWAGRFLVEGDGVSMPQAWNMNGAGDDCGDPGFGFNLGNLGQDFCVDNEPIVPSRIAPPTPFPAVRDDGFVFPADACFGPMLMGRGPGQEQEQEQGQGPVWPKDLRLSRLD